ncbi:MAG TPA: serine--tRNA ligase, partial [Myxococcota bacterium]|nr:serine--tRNA ligase [Myxococcota bacterium]
KGGDKAGVETARAELKDLKARIKTAEESQTSAETALEELLLTVPNLPQDSVPDGPDETANRVERTVGTPPRFEFEPKPHWELVEQLGIVSFEQAGKVSGARFAVYRGAGARLERALIQFMLDVARDNGYTEIAPPLLVRQESMVGAGQFPKFKGESFETQDGEFVLIPTSEVPLVNLHRDEILEEANLPVRYAAYTPCFRREAGAAGKDTRGLIRQHQFNKVELVAYTTPENSAAEHERLTGNAEAVLERLGLPYRVVTLCTGDLGFASTKTYDLEVWLPGQNAYREISSCSNCEDFQARRAKIRYRPDADGKKGKPRLVHTLNGSGVAVGRTFLAILENYQQADGSIRVPPALVPYFGAERITGP